MTLTLTGGYASRVTEAERRDRERSLQVDLYEKVRHASEVHRQVRRHAQSFIQPGSYRLDYLVIVLCFSIATIHPSSVLTSNPSITLNLHHSSLLSDESIHNTST